VIEIDKPPEGFETVGDYLDELQDVGELLDDPQDEEEEHEAA